MLQCFREPIDLRAAETPAAACNSFAHFLLLYLEGDSEVR